jgi:hypothetical protein
MYCAKCGVELADTEQRCPLCGTAAHPGILRQACAPLFPEHQPAVPQVNSRVVHIVVLTMFLLTMLICLQCDLLVTGTVSWAGYVIGALVCLYVILVLPSWFLRPNPVVFVPCGFAAVILYLLYLSIATKGGWFLSFAFPVTGAVGLIVTAVVALLKYVGKGELYIFGGAFALLGGFMPVMEWLLNLTFGFTHGFVWSLYPLTALVLLGGMLIFLAICRPARETMERKFFL